MIRRAVVLAACIIALVGAGFTVATAPESETIVEPFYVTGIVGDDVSSRLLAVRVHEVVVADQIVAKYRSEEQQLESAGVWVVVDVTVTPTTDTVSLDQAQLWIGDARYRPSGMIPSPSIQLITYGAGVPMRGDLVFEIPRSALDGQPASQASIVFSPAFQVRLDTVAVVVVDLESPDIERMVRIDPARVVDSK